MDSKERIYQLCEVYGAPVGPPVIGPLKLNLDALVSQYRTEAYVEAEAKEDDYCFVSEEGFLEWLFAKRLIRPLPLEMVTVIVSGTGEHAYVPKHWPACPSCENGRGEEEMGRVLHGLNRAEWFRKCNECGHTWEHKDQPYLPGKPMLEDDGRYIENGCVPYTISRTGGISIATAVAVCRERGWSESYGMDSHDGLSAARALGLSVDHVSLRHLNGKATLRRVLDILSPKSIYIIATNRHWLPVVRGENLDSAETSMRCEVLNCWEVAKAQGHD